MTSTLFKTATLAATLAAAMAAPLAAQAQQAAEGPWLVRVRAVSLNSANGDSTGLKLAINDRVIPEVDVSYFFTPEWAAELILTYPQKHDITAAGTKIGTLKHLPPTLTAQYHFNGLGAFRPYLGAGVNYTRFSGVSFVPAIATALNPSIEKDSFGLAVQVGFDYQVAKNVFLNVDVKKVQIRTDIKSFGAKVGEFKVDPVLFGVGVGYRF
jgi:outer membrane protein